MAYPFRYHLKPGLIARQANGLWQPGSVAGDVDPDIPFLPLESAAAAGGTGTLAVTLDAVTLSATGALAIHGTYAAVGAIVSLLTSGSDVDETSSATTASINVTVGVPVIIDVVNDSLNTNEDQVPTGITGPGGMTFTKVAETNPDVDFVWLSRWVAIPSSTASGTCTISYSTAQDAVVWSVHQVLGAGRLTNNGVDMFRQHVTANVASGSGTTDTATLAAYGDSVNRPLVAFMAENSSSTIRTATFEAGWTELSDGGGNIGSFSYALATAWRPDTSDTTTGITWTAGTGVKASITSEIYGSQDVHDVTLSATGTLGSAGIVGELAVTLDAVTLSATGTLAIQGTAAQTLDNVTLSASGTLPITGTLASTLGDVTLSASGTLPITGALAKTLDDVTLVATGAAGAITGTLSVTLDDTTLSGTGALAISGSLATTLDPVTVAAAGALAIAGVLASTLGDVTLVASGTLPITGALASTLDDVTLSASGTLPIVGSLSVTLGDVTLFATGVDPNAGGGGPADRPPKYQIVMTGRLMNG